MMTLKRDNVVKVVADGNDAAKLKAKGFRVIKQEEEEIVDLFASSEEIETKVTEAVEKKLTDKIEAVKKVAEEAKTVAEDAKATAEALPVPAAQPKQGEAANRATEKTTKAATK